MQEEGPLLGDEWEEELEGVPEEAVGKEDEAATLLKQLASEAAAESAVDDDLPEDDKLTDSLWNDLTNVPDQKDLHEIFRESVTADSPLHDLREYQVEKPEEIPKTLFHALWSLGPRHSDQEILDAIWRHTMYLRHWKKGGDREFIKNARICRKRSGELNWYQFLAYDLTNCLWMFFIFSMFLIF